MAAAAYWQGRMRVANPYPRFRVCVPCVCPVCVSRAVYVHLVLRASASFSACFLSFCLYRFSCDADILLGSVYGYNHI